MNSFFDGLYYVIKDLGIDKGDILYVSSDITAVLLGIVKYQSNNTGNISDILLNELVDLFQKSVGENGTVVLPAFSWEFCRTGFFDISNTEVEVGSLPNWVLKNRKDFKRTHHPIYSFLVWGKLRDELCCLDNQDAFAESSPFYYLMKRNAKQLFFDTDVYRGLTLCHCAEQKTRVPYRYPKLFFGDYIDEKKVKEFRMYSMFARDLSVDMDVGVKDEYLIKCGLGKQKEWKGISLLVINMRECYEAIISDISENNGKEFLSLNNYELDMDARPTKMYESNLEEIIERKGKRP